MDPIDNKSDLLKRLEEYTKKVDAIRKLPEYADFEKLRDEHQAFCDFIYDKRLEKTYNFILKIIEDDKVDEWIERLNRQRKRLSDLAWKKRVTSCPSNVMDHIWDVFQKCGKESDFADMFTSGAYTIDKYTMECFCGQGECAYAIHVNKRIF
jgi:hypothetical protein